MSIFLSTYKVLKSIIATLFMSTEELIMDGATDPEDIANRKRLVERIRHLRFH